LVTDMTTWLMHEPWGWPAVYFLLWAVAAALALLTGDRVKIVLAGLLGLEWVTHNLWIVRLGFGHLTPLGIAVTDIVLMLAIGIHGLKNKSQTAQVIVVLFWARFAIQIADQLSPSRHHGWAFWAMLNVTFALMVLSLMGASIHALARNWPLWRAARLLGHRHRIASARDNGAPGRP
jgi:hypothetical protein